MPRGKINWIAVRTAYLVQGWSLERCAEEFGVHPTTVKTRASTEGWKTERDKNATDTTAKATAEATTAIATAIATVEAAHARRLTLLDELLLTCKENIQAAKPGRSRQATIKDAMESLFLSFKIERLVMGRVEGQASLANAGEDGRKRIIFVGAEDEAATA